MTTAYGRWVTSLAHTSCKYKKSFYTPTLGYPFFNRGGGVAGTRGVSYAMHIHVVFLHSIYKNRDTSIV